MYLKQFVSWEEDVVQYWAFDMHAKTPDSVRVR